MKKKKIFIIINYDIYLKNFIFNNSFKEIQEKYDCLYLFDENLKKNSFASIKSIIKKIGKKKFLGFFNYPKKDQFLFRWLFNRQQWKNLDKFKNIRYFKDEYLRFKVFYPYEKDKKTLYLGFKRLALQLIKLINYYFNIIFRFAFIDKVISNKINTNSTILKLIKKHNPKVILIPFSGSHLSIFDTIRISKKLKSFKTYLISENWDNLFSRYFLQDHPDYIGVWGNQSKKALKIHKFNDKNSFILGSARNQIFFDKRNKKDKKIYNFSYASYFDFALTDKSDLEKTLFTIDEHITNNKNFYKNFKLIYRPHPYPFKKDLKILDFQKYKNVILDPNMESRYTYNISNKLVDDSEYLLNMIKNSKFIICAPTSQAIEASIFHKKIILYDPPMENSKNKGEALVDDWEHFNGVKNLDNIEYCRSIDQVIKKFENMFKKDKKLANSKIDKQLSYILFNNKKNYGTRLLDSLTKVIFSN